MNKDKALLRELVLHDLGYPLPKELNMYYSYIKNTINRTNITYEDPLYICRDKGNVCLFVYNEDSDILVLGFLAISISESDNIYIKSIVKHILKIT